MKMILKKRSIDGYVSIYQNQFHSRCAKYGFSGNVVNGYLRSLIDGAAMTLSENVRLGKEASAYARKIIKNCATALGLSSSEILRNFELVKSARAEKLTPYASLNSLFRIPDVTNSPMLHLIKKEVFGAKKYSSGNCGEYGSLALNYLRKQGVDNAETYSIGEDDHCFAVIGRAEGSNPSKPETWGPDAVVCDPWSDKVYPAIEIPSKLNCYRSEISNGMYENKAYPYDPTNNVLEPVLSIGGNDRPTKERALKEAHEKLNIIKVELQAFQGLENQGINALLLTIDQDINALTTLDFESFSSNSAFERTLSKIVRGDLKNAINVVDTRENQELLRLALVKGWTTCHRELPTMMLLPLYFDDLEHSDDSTVSILIDNLDQEALSRTVAERKEVGRGSILHIMAEHGNEKLFVKLLSRIENAALETADTIEISNDDVPIKLIQVACSYGWKDAFNVLVEKYRPEALLEILKKDPDFEDEVFKKMGPEALHYLLDKLSSEQVNSTPVGYFDEGVNTPIKRVYTAAINKLEYSFDKSLSELSSDDLNSMATLSIDGTFLPEIVRKKLSYDAFFSLLDKMPPAACDIVLNRIELANLRGATGLPYIWSTINDMTNDAAKDRCLKRLNTLAATLTESQRGSLSTKIDTLTKQLDENITSFEKKTKKRDETKKELQELTNTFDKLKEEATRALSSISNLKSERQLLKQQLLETQKKRPSDQASTAPVPDVQSNDAGMETLEKMEAELTGNIAVIEQLQPTLNGRIQSLEECVFNKDTPVVATTLEDVIPLIAQVSFLTKEKEQLEELTSRMTREIKKSNTILKKIHELSLSFVEHSKTLSSSSQSAATVIAEENGKLSQQLEEAKKEAEAAVQAESKNTSSTVAELPESALSSINQPLSSKQLDKQALLKERLALLKEPDKEKDYSADGALVGPLRASDSETKLR